MSIWQQANTPAVDITNRALGKHLFAACANPLGIDTSVAPIWTDGAGTMSDTDKTDPNYPTSALYDSQAHVWTRPASASNGWKLCMKLKGGSFNLVGLLGMNLVGLAGVGATVSVRIADDANFSVNVAVLAAMTGASNRAALLSMTATAQANQIITLANYLRLDFALISGVTPHIPQIGELVLGMGRQLAERSDMPYMPRAVRTTADQFRADGGPTQRLIHESQARVLRSPTIDSITSADWTTIQSLFTDSDSAPWMFIDDPSQTIVSGPNSWDGAPVLLLSPLESNFPYQGPYERPWQLPEMLEIPPFYESGL